MTINKKIEFNKEYLFEFDIGSVTKNTDHLTISELLDFVEKITSYGKKNLNIKWVYVDFVECHFLKKTKPVGKIKLKYTITLHKITFSMYQNEELTANGYCTITKLAH